MTRTPTALLSALAALAILGIGIAGCGSHGDAAAASPAATTTAAPSTAPTTATADPTGSPEIDHYVAAAKQVYDTETGGRPTLNLFHQVVDDPHLLALLHAGRDAEAERYATAMFQRTWAPEHMALLRFSSGGKTVLRLGVPWVVSPMPSRTVTRPGHAPMTIQIAEQDVIGFVRSMHNKHPAVQVVARDDRGVRAVSLLGVAARADLPATGFVTLKGVRYAVRSFPRSSFAHGVLPLTVWILLPTG